MSFASATRPDGRAEIGIGLGVFSRSIEKNPGPLSVKSKSSALRADSSELPWQSHTLPASLVVQLPKSKS